MSNANQPISLHDYIRRIWIQQQHRIRNTDRSPCNCGWIFPQEFFQGNIPQHNSHVTLKRSVWWCFYFFFGRLNDLVALKKFYPEIINLATPQMIPSACMWIQSVNCSELHKTWTIRFYTSLSLLWRQKFKPHKTDQEIERAKGGQIKKRKQSDEVRTEHYHEAFCKNFAFLPLYFCPPSYNPNSVSAATTETRILVLVSVVENYQILFCMQTIS